MAEELNNPLFEDEREFLERKKQEYERALRGDVAHIKDRGAQAGKAALVGAGLAGTIWLISKAFGGKKKKKDQRSARRAADSRFGASAAHAGHNNHFDEDDEFDSQDEAFARDRSAEFDHGQEDGRGTRRFAPDDDYQPAHSARQSAQAFLDADQPDQQADHQGDAYYDDYAPAHRSQLGSDEPAQDAGFDNGFGGSSSPADGGRRAAASNDLPPGRLDFGPAVHQHRQGAEPGQKPVLAYDDSRRLPESSDFRDEGKEHHDEVDYEVDGTRAPRRAQSSAGQRIGSALKSFLSTDTGKSVAAQVAAVTLAYVTKKVNDKLPVRATGKNADLANVPATTSFVTPPAPAPSTPAVSLTYTDAPTEHPAS